MMTSALLCLAAAIYHEARGEPEQGQQAVALVTMNRAEWENKRVCREVHKPGQYSWVGTGAKHSDKDAWQRARKVAADVLDGRVDDFTDGATYFHARKARPSWRRRLHYVMTVGGHRFYKPFE
jgi:spore germination cell wall hydrolase CwlJ-like protein